jgi:hypothetical protein
LKNSGVESTATPIQPPTASLEGNYVSVSTRGFPPEESRLGYSSDVLRRGIVVDLKRKGSCDMRRLLVVGTCFAVLAAGGAFAGEVKGPPGTINNTNETGSLDHAQSACAASGLNDLDEHEGQNVSQVQTAADAFKYYGLEPGVQGRGIPEFGVPGLCKGNN